MLSASKQTKKLEKAASRLEMSFFYDSFPPVCWSLKIFPQSILTCGETIPCALNFAKYITLR